MVVRPQRKVDRVATVLAQLMLGLVLGVVAIWLWDFGRHRLQPVDVIVRSERACMGSEVYVDGRRRLKISKRLSELSFPFGWHTIEARKPGFLSARARFQAVSEEQVYTTFIELRCGRGTERHRLHLIINAYQGPKQLGPRRQPQKRPR